MPAADWSAFKGWECCDREEDLSINKTTLNYLIHGCFAARAVKGPGSETSSTKGKLPCHKMHVAERIWHNKIKYVKYYFPRKFTERPLESIGTIPDYGPVGSLCKGYDLDIGFGVKFPVAHSASLIRDA